jgi:SAM-dependent methyltransferase
MAHPQQREFFQKVKDIYPLYFSNSSVLEIGSLNINGTVRDFFTDTTSYIGLDIAPGYCVDVVCQGQDYSEPDNTYDTVLSCECFEHTPHWLEIFKNMIRLCKSDGLVLFTCASTNRREHGTTRTEPSSNPLACVEEWSYYRNLIEEDFTSHHELMSSFKTYWFETNFESCDLYFCGIKK